MRSLQIKGLEDCGLQCSLVGLGVSFGLFFFFFKEGGKTGNI